MDILGSSLLGYFLGGINPSYLFGRLKGLDIRRIGSGNAGASNAMIMLGRTVGVISAAFDIFKAYLAYRLAGVALAYDPRVFFVLLAIEAVLAFAVNYICVVLTTASVMFAIVYGVQTKSLAGTLIFGLAVAVILYRHMENFRRIRQGIEVHLSWLWDRKNEIERVKGNYDGSYGDRGVEHS